ncbi:MAG: hypothetical protein DRH04_08030 [Deltaproteobacteria bacterium]|nr:MAG: hypothetical protein DRH04_08030 [Deltaproteobacteria bacterium]
MTGWRVSHQCPQCGAPVELEESDRLFTCPYCRVRLYLAWSGPCRYYLPPAEGSDDDLLYVPYWRAKGMLFSTRGTQVSKRLLDTSIRAAEVSGLPKSLGFRPQSLSLRFVTPEVPGRFLAVDTPLKTSVQALQQRRLAAGPGTMDFNSFVGEECSLIYTPVKRVGDHRFRDAIDGRELSSLIVAGSDERSHGHEYDDSTFSFIPTLCPACGWDLTGERDSLALLCPNCHTAWSASLNGLQPVNTMVFPADNTGEPVLQVPFWRLRVDIDGLEIHSYADLVRQANLPKMMESSWEKQPAFFWVPAFKIQPQLFLRLARNMTTMQPGGEPGCRIDASTFYPVTMPADEAAESLVILLATMILPRQRIFPLLPHLRFTLRESRLVFRPFKLQGAEAIEPGSGMALNRNALRWGRSI